MSSKLNDGMRPLSAFAARRLQDIWLTDFFEKAAARHEYGNTSRWWHCFLDFLDERGDEILPGALREKEEQLLALGKSQEYLAALLDVIQVNGQERNEYELAMLVLTASTEERAQALRVVLGGGL